MATESFERGKELGRQTRKLTADVYNLSKLMLLKSEKSCLFVPIRNMQFIAVIDNEEIIFVDSAKKRYIHSTWALFTPQARDSLTDPVPFTYIYYFPDGPEIMQRLQGEYSKSLRQLEQKLHKKNQIEYPNIILLNDKRETN